MTPSQKTALENLRFTVETARGTGLSEDEIIKAIKEPAFQDAIRTSEGELTLPTTKA